MRIFNQTKQKHFRQNLRKNLTDPERKLWNKLRSQQLGVKARRQHGVGPYIVDFYIPKAKLVIEIDGDSHYEDAKALLNDQHRDEYLRSLNLRIVRYTNNQVIHELDAVLEDLIRQIQV